VHAVHFCGRGTCEEEIRQRLLHRGRLAAQSFDDLAEIDPELIGRFVIGGEYVPPRSHHGDAVRAMHSAGRELRGAACLEARRVLSARAMAVHSAVEPVEVRPLATRLRRRRSVSRSCWIWRIVITTSDGEWLWATAIAAMRDSRSVPVDTPAAVRHALDTAGPEVEQAIRAAHEARVAAFNGELERPLRIALAREQAIADGIVRRRATLAAALIQRALFEDPVERRVARESAVLDEALGRCAGRLARLTAWRATTIGVRQVMLVAIVA
jgi:hypothetical protein